MDSDLFTPTDKDPSQQKSATTPQPNILYSFWVRNDSFPLKDYITQFLLQTIEIISVLPIPPSSVGILATHTHVWQYFLTVNKHGPTKVKLSLLKYPVSPQLPNIGHDVS